MDARTLLVRLPLGDARWPSFTRECKEDIAVSMPRHSTALDAPLVYGPEHLLGAACVLPPSLGSRARDDATQDSTCGYVERDIGLNL